MPEWCNVFFNISKVIQSLLHQVVHVIPLSFGWLLNASQTLGHIKEELEELLRIPLNLYSVLPDYENKEVVLVFQMFKIRHIFLSNLYSKFHPRSKCNINGTIKHNKLVFNHRPSNHFDILWSYRDSIYNRATATVLLRAPTDHVRTVRTPNTQSVLTTTNDTKSCMTW